MHRTDLTHVIAILPPDDRLPVWSRMPVICGGELLPGAPESVPRNLVNTMPHRPLRLALKQLDCADLAFIAKDIPEQLLNEYLATLLHDDQDWIRESPGFDESTVDNLMRCGMMVISATDTLEETAQHLRSLKEIPIQFATV